MYLYFQCGHCDIVDLCLYMCIYIYIYISLTSGKLKAGPLLLTKTALMLPLKAFRLVQRKKKAQKFTPLKKRNILENVFLENQLE
uniref:Uncharacterized protein n=1 Tax=Ixodes ricinus TaxID=34613 RepID=A0A0K8RKI4_IXORI